MAQRPNSDRGIHLVPARPPLAADVAAFLVDCRARGLAPTTVEFYTKKLRYLQTYLSHHNVTESSQVTPQHLRAYIAEMRESHNPGGVSQLYRAASVFFKWLVAEEIVSANPMEKLRAPKAPHEPLEPVSLDAVAAMVRTCKKTLTGQRDKAILLCLLDSGCRASEFVALNVGDVNMESGEVIVRKGKGGKFRITFFGAVALRELGRYLRKRGEVAPSDPLWIRIQRGRVRLTYNNLRHIVRHHADWAGIPEPGLHSFRRAFALLCLRGGMDPYDLQRLMGHSDLTTLLRYLALTRQDVQAAHRKAGPVDRWLR